jgi:hypothetical protein
VKDSSMSRTGAILVSSLLNVFWQLSNLGMWQLPIPLGSWGPFWSWLVFCRLRTDPSHHVWDTCKRFPNMKT